MASFSVYDGGTWRKAKGVWVYDGGTWRKAKGAWVYDGATWRKGFISEKTVSITIPLTDVAMYYHNTGATEWDIAKQGYYSNYEVSGYLFPQNAASIRDKIYQLIPDFGSLIGVTSASLSVYRTQTGDHGYARTLRVKQAKNTALQAPTAVNGSCDFTVPAGANKWHYNLVCKSYANCLIDTIHNCINQVNGANNLLINSDNSSMSSNGPWSIDYMGIGDAKVDVTLKYIPK